jgi:cytochrome b involved in lipid metabolism
MVVIHPSVAGSLRVTPDGTTHTKEELHIIEAPKTQECNVEDLASCSGCCGTLSQKRISQDCSTNASSLPSSNAGTGNSFLRRRSFDPTKIFYSMSEVRRHDTEESAWIVAGDAIYDVTHYIRLHPGGDQSLLKRAGGARDCTDDFNFHGKNSRKLWARYRIGTLNRQCKPDGDRNWWAFWIQ